MGRLSIMPFGRGKPLGPDGDQTAGLLEHDFGRDRRYRLAEKAIALAVLYLFVGPDSKLIRRRHMSKICGAAPHNEAEHHFRRAVLAVGRRVHRVNVKLSARRLQGKRPARPRIHGTQSKLLTLLVTKLSKQDILSSLSSIQEVSGK